MNTASNKVFGMSSNVCELYFSLFIQKETAKVSFDVQQIKHLYDWDILRTAMFGLTNLLTYIM